MIAWKAIDEDGEPNTFSDQELAAGWAFTRSGGALFGSDPVTVRERGGYAWFAVSELYHDR